MAAGNADGSRDGDLSKALVFRSLQIETLHVLLSREVKRCRDLSAANVDLTARLERVTADLAIANTVADGLRRQLAGRQHQSEPPEAVTSVEQPTRTPISRLSIPVDYARDEREFQTPREQPSPRSLQGACSPRSQREPRSSPMSPRDSRSSRPTSLVSMLDSSSEGRDADDDINNDEEDDQVADTLEQARPSVRRRSMSISMMTLSNDDDERNRRRAMPLSVSSDRPFRLRNDEGGHFQPANRQNPVDRRRHTVTDVISDDTRAGAVVGTGRRSSDHQKRIQSGPPAMPTGATTSEWGAARAPSILLQRALQFSDRRASIQRRRTGTLLMPTTSEAPSPIRRQTEYTAR